MPIGTLIKKIQCHESWSTKNPPTSGPNTPAIPQAEPMKPSTFARFSNGYTSAIIVIVDGKIPPAPIPWIARKIINCSIFCANPQSDEPIIKIIVAITKIFFRPYKSDSFP